MKVMLDWDEFKQSCIDKKVVVFGVGSLTRIVVGAIESEPVMAVDNNSGKQGMRVSDILGEEVILSDDVVYSPSMIVDRYKPEEIVVVIASYHVTEISKQLESMGIKYIFDGANLACQRKKQLMNINDRQLEDIQNNKICIMMGNYGGHGYYLTQEFLHRNVDIDIVWILRNPKKYVPKGVRTVFDGNITNFINELSTAKVWIFDTLLPEYVHKRKGQYYIQVKHWGSITLKKFYKDEKDYLKNIDNIRKLQQNVDMMDYIITGSEFDKDSCRSGFGYDGEFIEAGSPRTDAMFDEKNAVSVYDYFGINREVHLAMYAPTYRDEDNGVMEELDCDRLIQALTNRFGGQWKVMLRYHPSEMMKANELGKEKNIINACLYENSQELCAAVDVMVTDYSSIMFEPAFVHKPVFLYAPDRNSYIGGERELLIEYDELPFPIAETNDKLAQCISSFNQSEYDQSIDRFLKKYNVHEDGHASERAVDKILKLMNCVE